MDPTQTQNFEVKTMSRVNSVTRTIHGRNVLRMPETLKMNIIMNIIVKLIS
jgi:hypothetical protein